MNRSLKINHLKQAFALFIFLTLTVTPAFASGASGALGDLSKALGIILGFFSSGFMKAILSIALGALAVGLVINRGEPGIVKKFIPWIVSCILLLSLPAITGIIFNPKGGAEITPSYEAYGK
jgi:uncharacterized membrane protein